MEETAQVKRQKLVEDSTQVQKMICSQHDRRIEIYCHTDRRGICYLCKLDEHISHVTAAAVTERTEKQLELWNNQNKFRMRIQENQMKVQKLKEAVKNIKHSAQAAVENNERIFTELIDFMVTTRLEVTEMIRDQEKAELGRAEDLIKQLEKEIDDLNETVSKLEQLSHTQDHIYFLERFQSLVGSYQPEDSPIITVNPDFSFDGVRDSLSHLKATVQKFSKDEFKKVFINVAVQMTGPVEPKSREDFLKYFRHLTLDPITANPNLILFEKGRMVTGNLTEQPYVENQERFSDWFQVFCKENVSGRCYWEVNWSGNVFISVSYKGISRKGQGNECVFGFNDQSWSLECRQYSLYFWHNNIGTKLQGNASSRIGVYVDYKAGTLSFYSVSAIMRLLHRVQTTFTQPLYAGFRVHFKSSVRLCAIK